MGENKAMGRAIGIRVHKKEGEQRLDASKFFGAPTIPLSWENDFYEDEIFFCQIRLEDIKEYDTENKLPHKGYLYIFLDTEEGDYSLRARVRYYDGEPELALLSFNETVEGYEYLNEEWQMEFYDAEEDAPSTRLSVCRRIGITRIHLPSCFCNLIRLIRQWAFLNFWTDSFTSSSVMTNGILKTSL